MQQKIHQFLACAEIIEYWKTKDHSNQKSKSSYVNKSMINLKKMYGHGPNTHHEIGKALQCIQMLKAY